MHPATSKAGRGSDVTRMALSGVRLLLKPHLEEKNRFIVFICGAHMKIQLNKGPRVIAIPILWPQSYRSA